MTTLIIADDHNIVREGIRAILEHVPDVQVLAEATDGLVAVQLVQDLKPEVLLIDLSMPRLNGIEAIQRLAALDSQTRIIVLSIHAEEAIVLRALRAGAKGYLLKDSFKEELFLAIRTVARGQMYLSPHISEILLTDMITGDGAPVANPIETLSVREHEIFQLILEGQTNRQMATLLNISIKTVDKHRTHLMKKLNVHDVSGLMHIAVQNGLLYVR